MKRGGFAGSGPVSGSPGSLAACSAGGVGAQSETSLRFGRFEVGAIENPVRETVSDRRPRRILLLVGEWSVTLVRKEHFMTFSWPRPENEDRRPRELAVCGSDGYRLVSVQHDPVARVTTYVWAIDDGPPAPRSILGTKKSMCPRRLWSAQRCRDSETGTQCPRFIYPVHITSLGMASKELHHDHAKSRFR